MKVFLSSTALDLVEYRQAADDTILRLSQESIVMERFGPLPGEPVAECERKARESDIIICIVAHRYGFVPDKGRGSITQREVQAAKTAGKDVLVWIVADDFPWTAKKEQDLLTDPTVRTDPARVSEVVEAVTALDDFKVWLRKTFVYDTFTTSENLAKKIAIALSARVTRPHASTALPKRGEIRVVHALQPAPHFRGREALVTELTAWVADLASPDRVWSLVAAGGTGKTAIVERVVRDMKPGEANVLVWSFYEKPNADDFLRECNQLFLGENEGPTGGRLERLERGLRDGRPHLIVLDGLERAQEDAGGGRVRGEISDHTLKLLLRALAAGLGRARALVTSRFPLVDLQDWDKRGYRETRLDDLTPEAAIAVLRGWEVNGDDGALRAAAAQVGNHALSVAVIGSYLRSFAGGRIEEVARFNLDSVVGEDPRAARLARVLASYAEQLPHEERDLLARLSVFPRGVGVELLGVLIAAGGEVAGLLLNAQPRLLQILMRLKNRGLVFEYKTDDAITWTAHPFLRDRFKGLLGCPTEKVFDVVSRQLGADLTSRPETQPTDTRTLDRYEQLIEATRLAGREPEAYRLYQTTMGYRHLATVLGEFARGYRVLKGFSPTGEPGDLGQTLTVDVRSIVANDLALFAGKLGRMNEAQLISGVAIRLMESLGVPSDTSVTLLNASETAWNAGRLVDAAELADRAFAAAKTGGDETQQKHSACMRGCTAHLRGEIRTARTCFERATELEGGPLYSLCAALHARHRIDLGRLDAGQALCEHGLEEANFEGWNSELPLFKVLLARIALVSGQSPATYLEEIRAWTSRTGQMQLIVETHLLAAWHVLITGDAQTALGEAETGLIHAVSYGYGLLRIELLVTLARIRLAWPDPPKAIQLAREALDLATAPECGYAWGEADAAQVWGEAYFTNHESALAKRAFTQALDMRKRIEHPGVAETEKWLARVS